MKRSLTNLAIVVTMAVIVGGVLVLTTDSVRLDDGDGERIESTNPDTAATEPAPDDDAAPAATAAPASNDTPDTPSYLDPEPIADPDETAQVLGIAQVQQGDALPETGPVPVARWTIAACCLIAAGGLFRRASDLAIERT